MIRVVLPTHLRVLAGVDREISVDVAAGSAVTIDAILDAVEAKYPMLRGTIRDHGSLARRAMVRFFACEEDWSHEPTDKVLPEKVARGEEAFYIIGAIAGG
jgi:molybdopterin synthase sulfur carrier subunit